MFWVIVAFDFDFAGFVYDICCLTLVGLVDLEFLVLVDLIGLDI